MTSDPGHIKLISAFQGAKVTRDGVSVEVVSINTADEGYLFDVEVVGDDD